MCNARSASYKRAQAMLSDASKLLSMYNDTCMDFIEGGYKIFIGNDWAQQFTIHRPLTPEEFGLIDAFVTGGGAIEHFFF